MTAMQQERSQEALLQLQPLCQEEIVINLFAAITAARRKEMRTSQILLLLLCLHKCN